MLCGGPDQETHQGKHRDGLCNAYVHPGTGSAVIHRSVERKGFRTFCNFSDSFGLLKTNAPGVGVGLAAFCPKMDSNFPGTAVTAPGLGTAGTGMPAPPGTPFNGNRESTTGVNGVSGNNAVSEDPIALLAKALKPNGLF